MNLKKYSFLLFLLAAGTSVVQAQKLKEDPRLLKGKLKNGFTYYIYQHADVPRQATLRLFLNAGSMQEEEDQRGLAHFVEHMAFNGTKNFAKNEVISFLESKGVKFGADLNAHTSFDETVYKISINAAEEQNLQKSIAILADMAFGITFDSLEIEKERGVVMEEWRSKQGAGNRMRDQYIPVLFKDSRYAERAPIGTTEVLQSFPRQRILDFYQSWYRTDLMALAVVTDMDPRKVEGFIKEAFGSVRTPKKPRRVFYSLPPHQDSLFSIVTDKEATGVELTVFKKTPAFKSVNTEATFKDQLLRVFFSNLARARFARLSQLQSAYRDGGLSIGNLVLKNGMVASSLSLYKDQVQEGIEKYFTELGRIYQHGFTAGEIEKLKKEYLQQLERAAKTVDKVPASTYADELKSVFFNNSTLISREEKYNLVRRLLPVVDSVSVLAYARQFNTPGNTVVLLTAPEKERRNLPSEDELRTLLTKAATTPMQPWQDIVTVPDRLLKAPPAAGKIISEAKIDSVGVTTWKLSNGVTVYLKPTREEKERIMLSGFREGGLYAMDSSQYVSAVFSKAVIGDSGAGAFTRKALSQFLTGNTASATFVISNSREGVVAGADMKDVKTMFELLYLKWTQPRMDSMVFAQTKKQAVESSANGQASPTYAYTRALSKLINEDNYITEGFTPERIEQELKPEGILPAFESRFGSARDFQFVILGTFAPDSLRSLVETYLGGLPAPAFENQYHYSGPQEKPFSDSLVMYAGAAPRSTVNLFFQSNDIVYDYPVMIRQQLLEEVLKVKLRINLREENSGVYGVGVSISSTSKPGNLIRSRVMFTCAPESVNFLTAQAMEEIKKVAAQSAYFKEELARIKTQVLDAYKKQSEKNSFWSAGLRNHFYYQLNGWSYFTDYEKMVDAVTPEDIARFSQKYLVETPYIKAILMPESAKP